MKRKAAAGAAALLLVALGVTLAAVPRVAPKPTHPEQVRPHEPLFDSAAALAWRQFDRLWIPQTGFAKATPDYEKITPWDIGSTLAALYSAARLGLIDSTEYRARVTRTLVTLDSIALFDSVFHKLYHARTARLVGKGGAPARKGYAYSATDLGRLLVWLKIVERGDSTVAPLARHVAGRVNLSRVVEDGYLHGEELSPRRRSGVRRFQEGRIGYEQYSAHGFALWGADVTPALDVRANAAPVVVDSVELSRDTRGMDRLTSEPFVLLGLELGWTPAESLLSVNVLRAQEARYRRTGAVTVVSEDAVGIPPHYFYYYCVYCSGRPFVVETAIPGRPLDSPRWVSTKATFAWHALVPNDYTRAALEYVAAARGEDGWRSGVMEKTAKPTRGFDVNTAAVILEAAAYHRLGRPLIDASPTASAR